jgi:hypothetical protein
VTASVNVQVPPPHVKVTGVLVTVLGSVQPAMAGAELSISRCKKKLSVSPGFTRSLAASRAASRAPFCTDTPKTNARPVSIMPSSRSNVTGRISANSTTACAWLMFRFQGEGLGKMGTRAESTHTQLENNPKLPEVGEYVSPLLGCGSSE